MAFERGVLSRAVRRAVDRFAPDVVHIWTPRHLPSRVGLEISVATGARLVVHHEDDEEFLLAHFGRKTRFCADDVALYRLLEAEELDTERLALVASSIDVEFVRRTVLEPTGWNWIHPILSAIAMRFADAFTAISPALEDVLRRRSPKPVRLVRPGVDFVRFGPLARPAALPAALGAPGRTILLYSGAIADVHDFTAYLHALPLVVPHHPDVLLVQIGRNDIPDVTRRLVRELRLEDRVRFLGPVPHRRMAEYLALGDVYLAPTRVDGFNQSRLPAKIPEYMAMARPMVIGPAGVGAELVDEREVVRVGSDAPGEIADGLTRLLNRRAEWSAMGARLRSKAAEWFDWTRNADALLAFYRELESESPPDAPEGADPDAGLDAAAEIVRSFLRPGRRRADAPLRLTILAGPQLGPGDGETRYREIGAELSRDFEVSVGSEDPESLAAPGYETFRWSADDPLATLRRLRQSDVVVVQASAWGDLPDLSGLSARIVVDLHEWPRDSAAGAAAGSGAAPGQLGSAVLRRALMTADYVLCCSERQRDWAIGVLDGLGRADSGEKRDPLAATDLVALLPRGLPDAAPPTPIEGVRGPGVGLDALVLVLAAVAHPAFDPVPIVRAMPLVASRCPRAKLLILPPPQGTSFRVDQSCERAVELAADLGVLDSLVLLAPGGLDASARTAMAAAADIGIAAWRGDSERGCSCHGIVPEYLAWSLPIITSRSDGQAHLVTREGLGYAVDLDDDAGWAEAVLALADQAARAACRSRVHRVRARLTWSSAVAPLRDYCRRTGEASRSLARGADPRDEVARWRARAERLEEEHRRVSAALRERNRQVDALRRLPLARTLWRLTRRFGARGLWGTAG